MPFLERLDGAVVSAPPRHGVGIQHSANLGAIRGGLIRLSIELSFWFYLIKVAADNRAYRSRAGMRRISYTESP